MHAFTPVRGDAGFTLIELLVVILIIGILAAIGIPALLSQRDKAKNAAAKSAVRTALTAAKTIYTEDDNFGGADPAGLDRVEPTLYVGATPAEPANTQRPGDTAEPKDIWIGDGTGEANPVAGSEAITLCSVSKGNSIACIYDNEQTGDVKYREFVIGKNGIGDQLRPQQITGVGTEVYPSAATVTEDTF